MILITGGLGFIGAHTARALLALGESCVLTRHRPAEPPEFLVDDLGQRVFIEPLDYTNLDALLALRDRYEITGIVHLAAASPGQDVVADLRSYLDGLVNVLDAATRWTVRRISIASSLGVYLGVTESPFREDAPLPMTPVDPIPVLKKTAELVGSLVADRAGLEVIGLRMATVWGPLRRHNEPPFAALPELVHSGGLSHQPVYAEDWRDVCYVKDIARGIALLQTAAHLNHRTYNVAEGRAVSNADIVAAITDALRDARIDLLRGHRPDVAAGAGPRGYLDIGRIRHDTGYRPEYSLADGLADHMHWLRSHNY
jgi:UDP-glucose 4-epimerase